MNFDFDGHRRSRRRILALKNTTTWFVIFIDGIEFSVARVRFNESKGHEGTDSTEESFHQGHPCYK